MGRSRWGSVRKLPSGRNQARYQIDGVWKTAPTTVATIQQVFELADAMGRVAER